MKKLRTRLFYGVSCLMLGFVLGTATNTAICGLKRIRSESELKEIVEKHKLKQDYINSVITKDTVKNNAKRILRIEQYLFNMKGK